MNFEAFSQGNSFLHRTDPRVKVIAATGFAGTVAMSRSFETLILALILAVGLMIAARFDRREVSRRLIVVNSFIGLLWLLLPISFPGRTLFQVGPFDVTHEGMRTTLAITLRTNAIVLATIALLGTASIFQLIHALRHLRMPLKLVQIFFFCFRYVSVIEQEYLRLRRAMTVRCFRPHTSIHTYRSLAYLVGMLLIRSYERSERIYQAMLCRGFRGEYPVYRHFQMRRQDWGYLTGTIFAVALLIILETST